MKFISLLTGAAIIAAVALASEAVFAYVMNSPNYQIKFDSINVGGVRQTSDNYFSEDTIGEIATGFSSSSSYALYAGYQQIDGGYIALSLPTSTALSPNLGGITGGVSNASFIATVTTDSPSGYALSVRSTTVPALASLVDSFGDYETDLPATPDYNWQVDLDASAFGYSVEGVNVLSKFKDNGVDTCGVGLATTSDTCWYPFGTSSEEITHAYTANHPSGEGTVVKLRAESGVNHLQTAGDYQATLHFTAVTN